MYCRKHVGVNAVGQCSKCGSFVCAECATNGSKFLSGTGTLCVQCAKEELLGIEDYYVQEKAKHWKTIILGILGYIVGLYCIFQGLATDAVQQALFGMIICGLPTALAGWRKGEQMHDEQERMWGREYEVTSSGVYYKDGFFGKVIMFLLGAALGVIVTPFRVIKSFFGIAKTKRELQEVNEAISYLNNL